MPHGPTIASSPVVSSRVSSRWLGVLPLAPMLAGLVLSTLRFQAGDSWGGILFGEAGVLLTFLVAFLMAKSDPDRG